IWGRPATPHRPEPSRPRLMRLSFGFAIVVLEPVRGSFSLLPDPRPGSLLSGFWHDRVAAPANSS
ncbi:MAG TPA: hypothetical protein VE817_10485, partial [Candidatus Acidoferrum sp.]|nr:hypothetical protein [Candidatus Acidoferrum sp.]